MAPFEIPAEYADKLEVIDQVDTRSNDEILRSINEYVPVTSEKNIWAFWHSGLMTMPAWCQRNVVDWVRICGPEWTVRVVDNEPTSPNYVLKHLSESSFATLLPGAFILGRMDGPFSGQHSADMVRGATIYEHGGAWMDVGSILSQSIDRLCWDDLSDPESPHQVAVMLTYGTAIMNFFIAARKHDPFIQRWHSLFVHLWQGRTNHEGLIENPLVSFAQAITFDEAESIGVSWDISVPPKMVLEYLIQCICWIRIAMLEDAGDGFSGADYWTKHVLALNVVKESWPIESIIGFNRGGQVPMDLLSLPVDGDKTTEDYKTAEKLVWTILSDSGMQKLSRGGKHLKHATLGSLWDKPENFEKDHAPGTFAELLRYGTVHFRQKRQTPHTMTPERSPMTMKKGVLEP